MLMRIPALGLSTEACADEAFQNSVDLPLHCWSCAIAYLEAFVGSVGVLFLFLVDTCDSECDVDGVESSCVWDRYGRPGWQENDLVQNDEIEGAVWGLGEQLEVRSCLRVKLFVD